MTAVLAPALVRRRPPFSFGRWLEREGVFSWLMVALPVAFLVGLVGYPFFYGIWISLQDRPVAKPGEFVGLANFVAAWHDPIFRQVATSEGPVAAVSGSQITAGGLSENMGVIPSRAKRSYQNWNCWAFCSIERLSGRGGIRGFSSRLKDMAALGTSRDLRPIVGFGAVLAPVYVGYIDLPHLDLIIPKLGKEI